MGTEHITVLVCNRCGMRVEGSPPGWLHLTRPSVSYCPKCRNGDAPNGSQYDEDYFLRGKQTGKSLYEDYRWLPELTRPMVAAMVSHTGIKPTDTILDFGCARGYVVRAFRELGYEAWGYDVSKWAIENADEVARDYIIVDRSRLTSIIPSDGFDWVIAKDVLEHVPHVQSAINMLMNVAYAGVFAVVPLGEPGGDSYIIEEYEKDVTHIHRMTLPVWAAMFMKPGWAVDARYRVPGVKDNYAQHSTGNGFITARRI